MQVVGTPLENNGQVNSGVPSIGPGQAMARPWDMIGRAKWGRWPDVARPIQPAYCHDGKPNDGHYVQ